jgi:hypothetical protein
LNRALPGISIVPLDDEYEKATKYGFGKTPVLSEVPRT